MVITCVAIAVILNQKSAVADKLKHHEVDKKEIVGKENNRQQYGRPTSSYTSYQQPYGGQPGYPPYNQPGYPRPTYGPTVSPNYVRLPNGQYVPANQYPGNMVTTYRPSYYNGVNGPVYMGQQGYYFNTTLAFPYNMFPPTTTIPPLPFPWNMMYPTTTPPPIFPYNVANILFPTTTTTRFPYYYPYRYRGGFGFDGKK